MKLGVPVLLFVISVFVAACGQTLQALLCAHSPLYL
jgi:predicted small secreted protein